MPVPAKDLPPNLLSDLQPWLCDRVYNIVHLIHQSKAHDEQYKDYAFSPAAMREHWTGGMTDMRRTLGHADWFLSDEGQGFLARLRAGVAA